jgi:hypothetical protein
MHEKTRFDSFRKGRTAIATSLTNIRRHECVIGTRKNTLGPHHNGALRGSAGPALFQKAPESGPPGGQ